MAGDLEDDARGSEVGVGGVERGGAVRADGRDDEDRRCGGRGAAEKHRHFYLFIFPSPFAPAGFDVLLCLCSGVCKDENEK
jgi:hypothetical protein